ncbi:MAG: helix-turn-helix transcriptional regulator [Candidatus Obscuribacterales bacterium]|nr:helix-turn-helix transcriptional regulator [Candidatus Obscuribacterales bacterium]
MVEAARKSIPGRDPNLPTFIIDRMEDLNLKPTLTQLALGTGTPINTLRQNLNGARAMRLETAVKIAEFLDCDLSELVRNAGLV